MAGKARPRARRPQDATPLSRQRILLTALAYVDANGLTALTMQKVGADLGVQAMSLYYYVENKDAMLDGLVDQMWSEIDPESIDGTSWQSAARSLAHALRDLVHRHPHAAPLLMSRRVTSTAQLRVYAAYLNALQQAGFDPDRAKELLRIVVAYGFGFAHTELAALAPPPGDHDDKPQPPRRMNHSHVELPGDLREVAQDFCRDVDTKAHFDLGLDLMLHGGATLG